MTAFFFEGYTWQTILAFVCTLLGLLLLNEVTRRSKIASVILYIVFPVVLTIFVWPKTAAEKTNFAWIKTYSALAGVLMFMGIRYFKSWQNKKWLLLLPGIILALNIAEAVIVDFRIFASHCGTTCMKDGLLIHGGIWNLMTGIAGVLNIITMTGYVGIKVSKKKSQDMIWPDQLWFWIIAYDLWNISYCYNAIPNRAMYAGMAILTAATIAEFAFRKGAWLQHRAQTLSMWAMFSLTFNYAARPGRLPSNAFEKFIQPLMSIESTGQAAPLLVLSIAGLAFNVGVFVYMIIRLTKVKKNPITNDIYTNLKSYKKVLSSNGLK